MTDAVARIDRLIAEVEALSIAPAGAAPSSANPPNFDESWRPYVPKGHTSFSWNVAPREQKFEEAPPTAPVKETAPKQEAAPKKQQAGKQQKQQKKGGKKGGKSAAAAPEKERSAFSRLDIRVGKVVEVAKHPNADRMFLEKIACGEDEPRQVISGLSDHYSIDEFRDSLLLVICNLKPVKLQKIESFGMVLCAASEDRKTVELVQPPSGAKVGDRIILEGEDISDYTPDAQVNAAPKKKNSPWNVAKPDMATNDALEACYQGKRFVTAEGKQFCTVKSLKGMQLS